MENPCSTTHYCTAVNRSTPSRSFRVNTQNLDVGDLSAFGSHTVYPTDLCTRGGCFDVLCQHLRFLHQALFYVVSVHFHLKDISGPKLALPHKGFPPTMSACIVWQISKSDVGREGSAQMSTSVRTSTLCRLRKKKAVEQQLGSKAVTWMTEPGPAIFRPLQESWPLMTRLTGSPTRSFQA